MASTMHTSQQSSMVSISATHSTCAWSFSTHTNCQFQKKTQWSRPLQIKQMARRSSLCHAFASRLPEGATERDAEYMRMCIELAQKALGFTSPNPMVGCVIVKDDNIIGRGFHPKAGEPHAEVRHCFSQHMVVFFTHNAHPYFNACLTYVCMYIPQYIHTHTHTNKHTFFHMSVHAYLGPSYMHASIHTHHGLLFFEVSSRNIAKETKNERLLKRSL